MNRGAPGESWRGGPQGELEQAHTQRRDIGGLSLPPEKKHPYAYAVERMQLKFVEPACSTVPAFTRLHLLTYFSPRLSIVVIFVAAETDSEETATP